MERAAPRDESVKAALVVAVVAVVVYAADQATKAAIVASLGLGDRLPLIGDLLQLWHARNTGAAFSLFQGETALFFVVTVVAVVMIGYFFFAFRGRSLWLHALLGVILGGTLGNFTDRLRFGYVTDFVSVGLGDLRFPTFNVADSAVVVGILALVAYLTFIDPRRGSDGP